MKKTIIILLLVLTGAATPAMGQYVAMVHKANLPIRIDRDVNIAFDINIPNEITPGILNSITVELGSNITPAQIDNISVYYTGKGSMLSTSNSGQFQQFGGGQTMYAHPAYAILKNKINVTQTAMQIKVDQPLGLNNNNFYVSVKLAANYDIASKFDINVTQIVVNNRPVTISSSGVMQPFRPAIAVRDTGDDSVHSYRIPGLVTTPKGTLVAVYDIRNFSNMDLQDDVQVGSSRSFDGGQTWEPMQTVIDMRGTDGLPDAQNGVGDPAILVDPTTGDLYTMALWTHGVGINRAWWGVHQGLDYRREAAQVLVSKSTDDGQTWSKPLNITSQVKDSSWYILLQGPGRGIVMRDGTLVFPFQYVDSARMPHATIVYSRDKGNKWTIGTPAYPNTTEAQVVELPTGELMLNMRDNRGGSRTIMTTTDMGRTWQPHSSNRKALPEPVCMASLIESPANQNTLNRDLLLFSNPNTTQGRSKITIKASLDNGATWLPENQLLLDEAMGWGYSCLTMVDPTTVGILYESSVGQMLFQAIPLTDIVKKTN